MKIFEELSDPQLKKQWRQLVMKYHPDKAKTGDEEVMKKINNAYEEGDAAFEKFVFELKNKGKKRTSTGKETTGEDLDKVQSEVYDDFNELKHILHDEKYFDTKIIKTKTGIDLKTKLRKGFLVLHFNNEDYKFDIYYTSGVHDEFHSDNFGKARTKYESILETEA